MNFSKSAILRESTKWWIVGAFLLIGTIFLVSRSSSDTTPVTTVSAPNNSDAKALQEQKPASAVIATQSTSADSTKPLVCDAAGCPECFQKIESGPNSNFAAFDPFLVAAAGESKPDEEADELKQNRDNLKAAFEEAAPASTKKASKSGTSADKKDTKNLLHFIEKVPTESDEWKKLSVEEKVARYLKMNVIFEPSDLTLVELAELLGDVLDVEVTIDKVALEEASYDTSTRHWIKSKRPRPLKFILSEAFRPHSVAYIVKYDSLVLTSVAKQVEEMVTKVYPVVDLVTPSPSDENEMSEPDFESLINLIQTTVQPKTWKEVSGDDNGGTIDRYHTTRLLVVRNSGEVHDELQDLLALLRAVKPAPAPQAQKVADVAPEQPDKIVRKIYYIAFEPQFGISGAKARIQGVLGAAGGAGFFCISPERTNVRAPALVASDHTPTHNAQLNSGGRPQNANAENGSTTASTPAEVILTTAQMKERMESLLEIIPTTIDPQSWNLGDKSIKIMENRLIVINSSATQIEIEKFLRGLKVVTRVETW
jgi:hypothetical protein